MAGRQFWFRLHSASSEVDSSISQGGYFGNGSIGGDKVLFIKGALETKGKSGFLVRKVGWEKSAVRARILVH